jgi:archaellum component FlaF (FlaF/FlaG flagellin family)
MLPPPVATSATPTAGGALTAGTYKYYITAINTFGETTISNELTGTTAAGNLTLTLLWAAVAGATGYKIYRTAAAGATGSELLLTTVGAVTTFNDVAVGAPAGAFPTINTAQTSGTYAPPVKFFPINSENLKFQQATNWRRPIRKTADIVGAVAGDVHIEGDIEMEALEDVVPYFLFASRTAVVKSGGPTNWIYTFTPTPAALPQRTLSITIERNTGVVFGYVGCVVGQYKFSISNGMLMFNCSIVGRDEASQTTPTPSFTTSVPFGAGQYSIEIPTATQVFDVDTFEWTCNDNADPQYRLKNTGRGAQFIKYGERALGLTCERDFDTRADYDAFKALTSQSFTITASKGVNNLITLLNGVAIKDTYELALSGEGDLVRASIAYQFPIDGSGISYTITVKTQESIS